MTCRSCTARIVWVTHPRTGRNAPIESAPSPEGNIRLDFHTGSYEVLSGDELAAAREAGEELHLNHFATCPNREQHRKDKP